MTTELTAMILLLPIENRHMCVERAENCPIEFLALRNASQASANL